MLELCGVAPVHGHRRAIHMQLSDDAASALLPPDQLRPERALVGTLPQTKQSNEDIPFRILVRQERLPAAVRSVVATEELDGLRTDLVVNLVDLETYTVAGMQGRDGAMGDTSRLGD